MSPAIFTHTVEVRWSDLDANQHMRHSAYADLCVASRVIIFPFVAGHSSWQES